MRTDIAGRARAALAGAAYGVALFLVGSAVGLVRVLTLEPSFGVLDSAAIELLLMLGLAFLLCASLVSRCAVPPGTGERLLMGGVALAVLLGAELGMGSWLGRMPDYRAPGGLLGLAGQVVAAMLPLVQACLFPRGLRPPP